MHTLTHLLAASLHHLAAWLLRTGGGFVFAGFLVDLFTAGVEIAVAVFKFIGEVGQIVFDSLKAAVRFAVRGVAWLTGVARDAYGALGDSLGHIFGAIGRWLGNLYCDYLDLKSRLKDFFGPVIDILKKIHDWYNIVWKSVVVPILNVIQRLRQSLVLLRIFHVKWAQKLDTDLAQLEGKIVSNFLLAKRWINLASNWINLLVDPAGIMREFPLVLGVLRGINSLWGALFGAPFTQGPGSSSGGPSRPVTTVWTETTAQVTTRSGDAGAIVDRNSDLRQELYSEMGVNFPGT